MVTVLEEWVRVRGVVSLVVRCETFVSSPSPCLQCERFKRFQQAIEEAEHSQVGKEKSYDI